MWNTYITRNIKMNSENVACTHKGILLHYWKNKIITNSEWRVYLETSKWSDVVFCIQILIFHVCMHGNKGQWEWV